jgi:hypothetical protein
MTSPSRRPASFVALVRSSAFAYRKSLTLGAAAVVGISASVGCGSDSGYDVSGWGGGYGGGYTETGDGGIVSIDSGIVLTGDASTDATTPTDGGEKTDAGDGGDGGGLGASCSGFANCGVGLACNAGVCAACGGSSGPCPCTSSSQCGTGLECVANACTPTADVCHYQTDCASGDVCDDGQCVSACTTSCTTGTCTKGACVTAPTGTSCSDDTACAGTSSPFCVDGHCAAACGGSGDSGTDGGACATGFTCNQGACVADTGPTVECTDSSQCSASGQTCVDNLCKFLCATSPDCTAHDSRFPTCAKDGVCRTAAEASPACKSQYDCAPGQDCIDNLCQ